MDFTPIGRVRSSRDQPVDDDWDAVACAIELDREVVRPEAVAGLDQYSHVEVVYLFDGVDPATVERGARHPRGNRDWPRTGILAQRARNRPNRLGVSRCRLLSVEGLTLQLRDLDAIDGTPVLDVKPWMAEFGPRGAVRQPTWSRELMAGYWSLAATERAGGAGKGTAGAAGQGAAHGGGAGTRRSYDRVASAYARELGDDLAAKPLDRALLTALAEMCEGGPLVDMGSGPGQVAGWLAAGGALSLACDISPAMCRAAADGGIRSVAGDMTSLPFRSGALAGLACLYAVIHLDRPERLAAYREFRRVLRPGGHALVAFHTSDAEVGEGGTRSVREWWGEEVDLIFRFLDPDQEAAEMAAAGLEEVGRLDREPMADGEYPSRRSYLLVRRSQE